MQGMTTGDRRGRLRRIPDQPMPAWFDERRRHLLEELITKLQVARDRPATAAGAAEALVLLEEVLPRLTEYRAVLTAWAIDPDGGDVTQEELARRTGRQPTTIGSRVKSHHVDQARGASSWT